MEERNICPVCNNKDSSKELLSKGAIYNVNCPRCGKYGISYSALANINFQENLVWRVVLSHWIRINQGNFDIELTSEKIKNILENNSQPKPKEQADNLIIWMGNTLIKPTQETSIAMLSLTSIIGAVDELGVHFIARHLIKEELIEEHDISIGIVSPQYKAKLTFKGWERFYELQRTNKDSRLAFMAMQYDNLTLQKIYSDVIIQSVGDTGFEIKKLDDVKKAGLIDDKLRVQIRRSKFIIADLSNDNNGAYWEAGYAEGLGMHVIYICEEEKFKKEKSHFDTNHHLTVTWENTKEGLEKFADELKATIRETFPSEAKMED